MATKPNKFAIRLEISSVEEQVLDDVSIFDTDFGDLQRTSKISDEVDIKIPTLDTNRDTVSIEVTTVDMHEKGISSGRTDIYKLGQGAIRLYKHRSRDYESASPVMDMLGILAIPAYLTSGDLLNYFGDSIRSIRCFRMIKAEHNCHFALLKFFKAQDAHIFISKFDGVRYNVRTAISSMCATAD